MERLQYYVPEHVESLPRLKAHYRVGISNAERCVLWKELLATNQAVEEEVAIDEAALTQREDVTADCQQLKFIDQCTNEAPEEISRKLQILILYFLQQNPSRVYHPRLRQAIFPFLAIGLSIEDAYRAFVCFAKIFLPKFFTEDKKVLQSKADLLRLLILYHDPALCYYMDQRGVSPVSYVQDWWSVLFFETCTDLTTVLTLWDNIFLAWDPYLYMFISLVLIMRTRDQIMAGEAQEIPLLVSTTQIGDFTEVSHLVQQALSFSETTPHAFRCQLCDVTQQTPLFFEFLHDHLKTALCLSVGIQDVVVVKKSSQDDIEKPPTGEPGLTGPKSPDHGTLLAHPPHPTENLHPGHPHADSTEHPHSPAHLDSHTSTHPHMPPHSPSLPPPHPHVPAHSHTQPAQHPHPHSHPHARNSAHRSHTRTPSSADDYPKFAQEVYDCRSLREYNCGHLPGSVHLDPEKLLNRLGVPQHSSKHIALLPRAAQSGDEQALILRLLQFGIPYVSCVSSGYEACHQMFKEGQIYLENHSEAGCFVCTGISPPLSSLADLNFTPSHQPEHTTLLLPQQLHELQHHHPMQPHHHNHPNNNDKLGLSSIFASSGKWTQIVKDTSASLVSGSKKLAENVGNINIKSILPKSESSDEDLPNNEEVDISGLDSSNYKSLQEWMMYESNEQFPCKKVKKDGSLEARRIIINDKELIFLEVHPTNSTYVRIKKVYNLNQLSQITYKRSTPKKLNFKLEVPTPASPQIDATLSPSTDTTFPLHSSTLPDTASPSQTTDFQEITLSPSAPHPPSPPLLQIKVKSFFVGEPTLLIDAVYQKVHKL
eukprot:Phypoly_transcript_03129.p1 GENE.Phypoly_transcript_03129~~Phypoly_transcript_03129.p1  ORF type:complete len:823 (+),score=106.10 Phypoly_transcript_03129:51-2519(+)